MSLHIELFGPHRKANKSRSKVDDMPVISATPIPPPQLGMKRPLVVVPPVPAPTQTPETLTPTSTSTTPAAVADSERGRRQDSWVHTTTTEDLTSEHVPPIEFERRFIVPASALAKVRTIPNVQRRMVYDTYLEPAVKGQPRLRFRVETSIDPLLGNSDDGSVVIAYSDFTVKTGTDASKMVETIYPVVIRRPNPVTTINTLSSIQGISLQTERYRWSGLEGNFQLTIYSSGPGFSDRLKIEIEAENEEELWAFTPPSTWREVTHEPKFSNFSIAACGWPE